MRRNTQLRLQAFAAVFVGLVAAAMLSGDRAGAPPIAGRLGPTPGPNATGHVEAKRGYLDRIASEDPDAKAAALVSFSRFVRSPDVATMVGGLKSSVVFVRFPESPFEAIALTKSLEETMSTRADELADDVRAEVVSLEAQLREAQGAERETLSASLERRRQALNGLTADCACIYAIGLESSTLAQLAALQGRGEVQLVDVPDPVTTSLEGWHLTPVVPAAGA
ncbi:MAG: hypothetical protein ACRDKJ_10350 [Actinomycetota bacterium]